MVIVVSWQCQNFSWQSKKNKSFGEIYFHALHCLGNFFFYFSLSFWCFSVNFIHFCANVCTKEFCSIKHLLLHQPSSCTYIRDGTLPTFKVIYFKSLQKKTQFFTSIPKFYKEPQIYDQTGAQAANPWEEGNLSFNLKNVFFG